jgi:hypothetical protein
MLATSREYANMTPVRIQRKRTAGYDMQAVSRAVNGLPCIGVTRPGHWGNPYDVRVFGRELAMKLFRNTIRGVWNPNAVKDVFDELCDLAYAAHHHFLRRLGLPPSSPLMISSGCELAMRIFFSKSPTASRVAAHCSQFGAVPVLRFSSPRNILRLVFSVPTLRPSREIGCQLNPRPPHPSRVFDERYHRHLRPKYS